MWFYNISKIMYDKCKTDDREEYWSLITDEFYIYWYCKYIKDRPELWSRLTDKVWICEYCKNVKYRSELKEKNLVDNQINF